MRNVASRRSHVVERKTFAAADCMLLSSYSRLRSAADATFIEPHDVIMWGFTVAAE